MRKTGRRTIKQIQQDIELGLKECSCCGELKPIEDFANGRYDRSTCKGCYNGIKKQRRMANKIQKKVMEQSSFAIKLQEEQNNKPKGLINYFVDWLFNGKR